MLHREHDAIEELTQMDHPFVRTRILNWVEHKGHRWPIHAFEIGSEDKERPTLALFGGVHGLEKVGTHVLIHFFRGLFYQLQWDKQLRKNLKKCRIVAIPLVNPGGMAMNKRCNPQGVDLMRNAPISSQERTTWLVSGHRVSRHLPWYRGRRNQPMEVEAQTLVDFVQEEVFPSKAAIALDCHSGFGIRDQIWYPYARTQVPFPAEQEVQALKMLLDQSIPYHVYQVEPQSLHYTTHGDLWDYLYDHHHEQNPDKLFLPLTLEMGSWMWLRKNPLQAFVRLGFFNPLKAHRHERTMRRHFSLIYFLLRAVRNHSSWKPNLIESFSFEDSPESSDTGDVFPDS